MQRKLAVRLHAFSRGVDGGIDICDAAKKPQIVIQAKHYARSKYSDLLRSLKKEVEKIEKINPTQYYVCTSLELTKNNKDKIVELFNGYMVDISSVMDKVEIDSFLQLPENDDIVKVHYKLWLCATNVLSLVYNQNVFIDCTELMLDIEKYIKLFVDTESFHEAKNKLITDKVIIITGAPGVGKSTISKMLSLFFVSEGYIARYATDNNISDIKKSLSIDSAKKELILLDDFLGQHYLKMKETQPNELKTLISFIERSRNKKLIMNSRITIFKEAIQSSIIFRELIEKHEANKYLIDLDKMPLFEKAKILYNHLFFNDLPRTYFTNIKSNQNYLKIVQHKNYNPRIIEYVTKKRNYGSVSPGEYFVYILRKLDNPEDVWKDEFRNRLEEVDRVLMNTLYTLTDTIIDMEILEAAFNKRMQKYKNLDTSINPFKNTIIRLNDSLLKIIEQKGKSKISVINPSINDYVREEIRCNSNEQVSIVNSAKYVEQILKIAQSEDAKEHVWEIIKAGDFLKIPVLKNSIFYYYFQLVVEWKIFDQGIYSSFLLSVERAYQNLSSEYKSDYAELYYKLFSHGFAEYYDFRSVFSRAEKMHFIIRPMFLDDVKEFFKIITEKYPDCDEYYDTFKTTIIEKIHEVVQEEADNDLYEKASKIISNADSSDISSYIEGDSYYLEDCLWDTIEELIHQNIKYNLASVSPALVIIIDDFDVTEMKYEFDLSGALHSVLQEEDHDEDNRYDRGASDLAAIRDMFEQ